MATNTDSSLSAQALANASRTQPKLPLGRVVCIEHMVDVLVASAGGGGTFVWRPLDPPLLDMGAQIEDITVHVRYTDCDSQLDWSVRLAWSYDGGDWVSDANATLVSELAPAVYSYKFSEPFSDRTYMGRHLRLELGLADDNTVRKMRVSIMSAIKFWSK